MVLVTESRQRTIQVLWTGGWDSTFRICWLLWNTDAYIEPHYLITPRKSTDVELSTMTSIASALGRLGGTFAERLRPLIVADAALWPVEDVHAERFRALLSIGPLGEQYLWLARYAEQVGKEFELAIHADDKATAVVRDFVTPVTSPVGPTFRLRPNHGYDAARLFERFSFPILSLTKVAMAREAQLQGFRTVMAETWFCHKPRGGKPCGVCGPCRDAASEGMGWRIPLERRLAGAALRPVLQVRDGLRRARRVRG